ncbi:hypothetical protein CEP52_016844 [Fusarium oligoseptatum]|uniref:Uncharacterized protein n=1 Tax=Fusarium oligoseptatum TaxID=2604345 RepID=A0A428RZC1_9HYPO|nr:hypothetical protein CEP52_016844 [Fusarium oligoseptatum]
MKDEILIEILKTRGSATEKFNKPQQRLTWQPDTGFKVIEISHIHLAASSGRNELVKFLLDRGVSVDDGADRTPLTSAILANQTKTVKLLMERGASVASRDGVGPLHLAASAGSMELLDLFTTRPDIEIHSGTSNPTAVSYALSAPSANWREVVTRLGEKGFKPTERDLAFAVEQGRASRLSKLSSKSGTLTGTKTAMDQGKFEERVSLFRKFLSQRYEQIMAALIEKWCGSGVDCDFKAADSCLTEANEACPELLKKLIPNKAIRDIEGLAERLELSRQPDTILDRFPQIFEVIRVLNKHFPEAWKHAHDRLCLFRLCKQLSAREYPLSADGCHRLLQAHPIKVKEFQFVQLGDGNTFTWLPLGTGSHPGPRMKKPRHTRRY